MSVEPKTRPSNFVVFAFVMVGVVIVLFAWATLRMPRHRSPDQKILIEKSKH